MEHLRYFLLGDWGFGLSVSRGMLNVEEVCCQEGEVVVYTWEEEVGLVAEGQDYLCGHFKVGALG